MIVPRYWAEGRARDRRGGRQITVRRFGWSNASLDDAQAMADARAREALEEAFRDPRVARREPKVPYHGAAGVPIREEIVDEQGDIVITRNSYGARCMNVPDVLIADVDCAAPVLDGRAAWVSLAIGVVIFAFARAALDGFLVALACGVAAAVGAGRAVVAARRRKIAQGGGARAIAQARVEAFARVHPSWAIRVYETPNGLRLIVVHARFAPDGGEVARFFHDVDVDRVYAMMCLRQRCFRARLTAKPWRIGIAAHMKPRPGVWPVREERRAERAAWIADYEARTASYAACRFVGTIGAADMPPEVARVVRLHDEASGALTDKPLA